MNFSLRPWDIEDVESLVKYANNPLIAKNLTNKFPYPYAESDGRWFINFATQDKPIHIFAIDMEGEAVGGIGIHPQDDVYCKNAELGYWLAQPFWGQGIVSQAIKQIIDIAFTLFDIERIYARPFGTNIASQRVLEKNHFILEVKFEKTFFKNNEMLDEYVYGFRRKQWNMKHT